MSYFMVSEVIWIMPEHTVDQIDKPLVKSMDFCEFLTTLTEDLKIEKVWKDTKLIKSDIFQGLVWVVYGGLTFSTLTFSTPLHTTPVGPPFLPAYPNNFNWHFQHTFHNNYPRNETFVCLFNYNQVTFTIRTTLWGEPPIIFSTHITLNSAFFPMHPPCTTNTFITFFDYHSKLLF